MQKKNNFDVDSFVDNLDSSTSGIIELESKDKSPCPYCGSDEYEELVRRPSKTNRRRLVTVGCTDCE